MSAIQNSFPKILGCLIGMTLASAALPRRPAVRSTPAFHRRRIQGSQDRDRCGRPKPSARMDGRSSSPTTRPSIRRRKMFLFRLSSSACAADRSGPCRSQPADRSDRRHGQRLAEGGARPALAGCHVSGQQQRQCGRPGRRVRLHECRQAGHGHARHRSIRSARACARDCDLRPEGRRLRRPCVMPGGVAVGTEETMPDTLKPICVVVMAVALAGLKLRGGGGAGGSHPVSRCGGRQEPGGLPAPRRGPCARS